MPDRSASVDNNKSFPDCCPAGVLLHLEATMSPDEEAAGRLVCLGAAGAAASAALALYARRIRPRLLT